MSQAATAKKKPKKWKAYNGPFFNNPHLPKDRWRLERRLLDTLKHVPKGETVRIAIYSFDRIPVANAIVAAHRRGVKIQMLLNDHWENRAMKMVRAELGTNRFAKSFIYKCKSGCRTLVDQYRNLHSKFYTFTRAGKSQQRPAWWGRSTSPTTRHATSGTTATSPPATSSSSSSSSPSSRT